MGTVRQEIDGALIQRYIDVTSDDRGPAYARLADCGTPVWATIGYWQAVQDDAQVATTRRCPCCASVPRIFASVGGRNPTDGSSSTLASNIFES